MGPGLRRDDDWGRHTFAFSRRDAPEVLLKFSLPPNRGRRESRVSDAPAAARVVVVSTRVSHHEFTGNIRHPPRDGVTAYFVLLCPQNLPECANGRFSTTARRWI
jgi:hypothetical protein